MKIKSVEVVGDPEGCEHRFSTTKQEKDDLRWLFGVLDKMADGCGANKQRAAGVRKTLARLIEHHGENHAKIHQLEGFIDRAFFTSPGGTPLDVSSEDVN